MIAEFSLNMLTISLTHVHTFFPHINWTQILLEVSNRVCV